MFPEVLDPDPASTIEADDEYIAAWHAAYGHVTPVPPIYPPISPGDPFYIPESVLPLYLQRAGLQDYIEDLIEDVNLEGLEAEEYVFSVPQTTWTVNHSLGRDPVAIQVFDTSGVLMSEWAIQYTIPDQQIRLGFDISLAGKVRIL